MNKQPIGIFDSGIGGLSVLKEIQQLLPDQSIIYIADSAHAPYGNKSHEFILRRCHELTRFLIEQHVGAIVIACNTATAVAVRELRETYDIPFVAMEPGVKPAIEATRSNTIGVLATENTLASEQFVNLVKRYGENVNVVSQPCPGLVEEIEAGDFHSEKIHALLKQYISPLRDAGADTIVLGCTHYPLVRDQIQAIAGKNITIIETGQAVALQLKRVLEQQSLSSDEKIDSKVSYWTSADVFPETLLARCIGGGSISFHHLSSDLTETQA